MEIKISDHKGHVYVLPAREFGRRVRSEPFVRFYDSAAIESDNVMQPLDWAVSALLQGPIRRNVAFEDLTAKSSAKWGDCNRALEALGADIPLESNHALDKRGMLEACFKAFMAPAFIGASIAAKTLHKKRPLLVPVVDDFVAKVLTGHPCTSYSKVTEIVFDYFRRQLVANQEALDEAIAEIGDLRLSKCRLLDIAIWMHANSHKSEYRL